MKRRWMSQSAAPATQSAATCRQVPRLPRKKPRRPRRPLRTERATSPVTYVPRLPDETKVDVSKCHVCHVKRRWMSPSATPARQKAAANTGARGNRARHQSHACHAKCSFMSPSATLVCVCVKHLHRCKTSILRSGFHVIIFTTIAGELGTL